MLKKKPDLESSWLSRLEDEFDKDYMRSLKSFLMEEMANHPVYPRGKLIFNAFDKTPFSKVRVVIIGQDPYHGPGQAHGLCFSVNKGIRTPPSLVNIFKEMKADIGLDIPNHGDLTEWAENGVLLLNTVLTVRHKTANSHRKKGWEIFTDKIIETLNEEKNNLVFVLWGKQAGQKSEMIDSKKHLIISSPHPSPFSADRGFFGSKPFSKINDFLKKRGQDPIEWKITNLDQ